MNDSQFKNGLIMIFCGILANFFGRLFAIGGLLGASGSTLGIGIIIAMISPFVIIIGILLSIYGYVSNPSKIIINALWTII